MSNDRTAADKNISAEELLQIINKQWATTSDIMKIRGCCYQTALSDRRAIEDQIKEKYPRLPRYMVPMEEVVLFYKINISYLKKISSFKK